MLGAGEWSFVKPLGGGNRIPLWEKLGYQEAQRAHHCQLTMLGREGLAQELVFTEANCVE